MNRGEYAANHGFSQITQMTRIEKSVKSAQSASSAIQTFSPQSLRVLLRFLRNPHWVLPLKRIGFSLCPYNFFYLCFIATVNNPSAQGFWSLPRLPADHRLRSVVSPLAMRDQQ